jgi:hypothetical protein
VLAVASQKRWPAISSSYLTSWPIMNVVLVLVVGVVAAIVVVVVVVVVNVALRKGGTPIHGCVDRQ